MNRMRLVVEGLIVVAALVLSSGLAWAAEDTTGKVTIETMAAGVGLGVTWGDGVLEYHGEKYPFTVAGGTFGGGAESGAMYSNNRVSMVWTGTNQGLNVTLAHSGVNVELTQEAKLQAAKVRRNVSAEEQQPAAAPRATP